MSPRALLRAWSIAGSIAGCLLSTGCGEDYQTCDRPDVARMAALPERLSEAGLYADIAAGRIAEDARAYAPAFELWSDGASKRRWIRLPAGTRIDTRDMDAWQFPQGTQLWKEFARDGVRVETRLFAKTGPAPDDWSAAAYVWQSDGKEARLQPDGVTDALGTGHDVPAAGQCLACHAGSAARILGFSAVQLAFDAPAGQLDLADLIDEGWLSQPPARHPVIPGRPEERAALGYLHANCGSCHNSSRPPSAGARCYDPENRLDLSLRVAELDQVASTGPYRTAVNFHVRPRRPDESPLIIRMSRRHPAGWGMPPLATEIVDEQAVERLSRWIATLGER